MVKGIKKILPAYPHNIHPKPKKSDRRKKYPNYSDLVLVWGGGADEAPLGGVDEVRMLLWRTNDPIGVFLARIILTFRFFIHSLLGDKKVQKKKAVGLRRKGRVNNVLGN